MAGSYSSLSTGLPTMTTLACTVLQNIFDKKFRTMERSSQSHDTALSTCIPNITTLACSVLQNRKKIRQIQGRISMRRLVCNPTIQYIIIYLQRNFDEKFHCSKYGSASIHSFSKARLVRKKVLSPLPHKKSPVCMGC